MKAKYEQQLFERDKAILDPMELAGALWWFIENVSSDAPHRTALFFYLRERVRGSQGKQYQFFADEAAVRAYVSNELLATLNDDHGKMQNEEQQHYTDEDRADMKARIADLELYFGD